MLARAMPIAALTAALLLPVGAQAPRTQVVTVFHDGAPVRLEMPSAPRARAALAFGPWRLGERDGMGEMKDKHPNLYVVCPGAQYTSRAEPQYDHTLIINSVPVGAEPEQWDVIWAIVMDPTLRTDFRDERALLLAAQETFRPNDLFDLSDVPGRAVLRDHLGVHTYRDLAAFERDGLLPRVLLQPAGFSLRAAALVPAGAAGGGAKRP